MCESDFDILRISFQCHLLQLAPRLLQAGSKLAATGSKLAAASSKLTAGSLQASSQLITGWLRIEAPPQK